MTYFICLALTLFVANAAAGKEPYSENFDKAKVGPLPEGEWRVGFYGAKGNPLWQVVADKDARTQPHLLKQSGNAVYTWLVKVNAKVKDGSISAAMRVASGKEDPEAGLVWRFVDGQNYFYMRMNATENNVVVYKMHAGKKVALKSVEVPVGNKWHRVLVEMMGADIRVRFDDKELLSLQDATFMEAGAVGFFTTADSVALFDDLTIKR